MITVVSQGKLPPLNYQDPLRYAGRKPFQRLAPAKCGTHSLHLNNNVIPLWKERSLTWHCPSLRCFAYMYTHAGSMSICKQCRHSIRKDVSKLSLYFLRFCGRKRGVNLLPFYSQMKSQYFPCSVPWQRKTEGRD